MVKTDSSLISLSSVAVASKQLKNVVLETPYLKHLGLSQKYHSSIYLKREDMQVVRSFKIRGAYNKIVSLSDDEKQKGVVCASAGNHAQGVALACSMLGIRAKIYMPNPTPKQKVEKVIKFGGEWVEIILSGDNFDESYEKALSISSSENLALVHPFDDPKVIAGQATIAREILEQAQEQLDYLLVAVGGGGLIAGVGSYFKQLSPKTKIVAVEAAGAPALHNSLDKGHKVKLDRLDTFADGVAVKEIGELNFKICQEIVDYSLLVPEGKICSTILSLYNEDAIVVEPAGAISIAALDQLKDQIKGKNVGIIVCGGNNDVNRTQEITERAMLYEGRKHYFIIRFPQRAGALRDFLEVLGPDDDIAHFQYTKKTNRAKGPALVGLELGNASDYSLLIERMKAKKINYEAINNSPMLFEMLV